MYLNPVPFLGTKGTGTNKSQTLGQRSTSTTLKFTRSMQVRGHVVKHARLQRLKAAISCMNERFFWIGLLLQKRTTEEVAV